MTAEREAIRKLWAALAAMTARARTEDLWRVIYGDQAQDLRAAEAVLRETKELTHENDR